MSLSKYMIFKTIIELGSLTKAAEKLNLTQSGVSYAVSTLEKEIGFPLLNRDRSGIRLTQNGQRVLMHIERILHEEELLRQEILNIGKVESGIVRLGTLSSVSMQWLPGILAEFHRMYPHMEVKTYLGCYDEMNDWIVNGTIDFGFISLPTSRPFDVMPLNKDKLVVLLPAGHPLQEEQSISFEQIKDEAFIMPQWGSDDNIRQLIKENKLNLRVKYEIMEERTIFAMVQMGMGISVLPKLILVNVPEGIKIVEFDQPHYRTLGLAALSWKGLAPAAQKFANCIVKWLRDNDFFNIEDEQTAAGKRKTV